MVKGNAVKLNAQQEKTARLAGYKAGSAFFFGILTTGVIAGVALSYFGQLSLLLSSFVMAPLAAAISVVTIALLGAIFTGLSVRAAKRAQLGSKPAADVTAAPPSIAVNLGLEQKRANPVLGVVDQGLVESHAKAIDELKALHPREEGQLAGAAENLEQRLNAQAALLSQKMDGLTQRLQDANDLLAKQQKDLSEQDKKIQTQGAELAALQLKLSEQDKQLSDKDASIQRLQADSSLWQGKFDRALRDKSFRDNQRKQLKPVAQSTGDEAQDEATQDDALTLATTSAPSKQPVKKGSVIGSLFSRRKGKQQPVTDASTSGGDANRDVADDALSVSSSKSLTLSQQLQRAALLAPVVNDPLLSQDDADSAPSLRQTTRL